MSDFETVPLGTLAELERVKEERDALAAHVERLIGLGTMVRDAAVNLDMEPDEFWDRMEKWDAGSIDMPATSLARRDARMKAEALEKSARGFRERSARGWDTLGAKNVSDQIELEADEYRRLAEGDES